MAARRNPPLPIFGIPEDNRAAQASVRTCSWEDPVPTDQSHLPLRSSQKLSELHLGFHYVTDDDPYSNINSLASFVNLESLMIGPPSENIC